jgi:hypothetical protein
MWSIKEIAERDGLTRAAVSKSVKKLLTLKPEIPVERGSQGQVLRVSLADYDHYREQRTFRTLTPGVRPIGKAARDPSESFDEARRQSEWLKVSREILNRQVDLGLLIDRKEMCQQMAKMGREIAAIITRLPNATDDIADSVSRDEAGAVRKALGNVAEKMCIEIENLVKSQLASMPDSRPERMGRDQSWGTSGS